MPPTNCPAAIVKDSQTDIDHINLHFLERRELRKSQDAHELFRIIEVSIFLVNCEPEGLERTAKCAEVPEATDVVRLY